MFLAINQNLHSAKKRKTHEEKQQQQEQQQQLDPRADECEEKKKKNSACPPIQTDGRLAAPTTTTNCVADNMLSVSATESTAAAAAAAAAASEKRKNCQRASQNNAFEQHRQQQQHQEQQQQQHRQHLTLDSAAKEIPHRDLHAASRGECCCSCCNCVNKSTRNDDGNTGSSSSSSSSNRCRRHAPPPPPALHAVYLCLGVLALALATLAILFHSHVSSAAEDCSAAHTLAAHTLAAHSLAAPPTDGTTVPPFEEQFRRELLASDDMLRSIVAAILQQQQQQQQQAGDEERPSVRQRTLDAGEAVVAGEAAAARATRMTRATAASPVETAARSSGYEPVENFRYPSTKLPYNADEIVKNERKFVRSSSGSSGSSITSEDGGFSKRRERRDISSHADPFIEFFNPNHRKALEEQDVEIRKRTGLKGAAPGGDEWIYLNTYCRVPEKIITGFCKGTQEYCPPSPAGPVGPVGPKGPTGPPGLPGIPGPKGNRGDVGLPGPPGVDGAPGVTGPRGPKGDIGIPGRVGLDGRDGVPGEPGLDGVPGRAGADGIPGKDGLAGRDGRDGKDGKDGKDGAQGPKGAPGPPGERGLKGIAGPRGRPGKSGSNGTPGIPGINAWKVQLVNGSFSSQLLVPPSIADLHAARMQRTVMVEEGKTLNLSCAATGYPAPHVEWRRDDGRTITVHATEMSSVSGSFLKFTNITRHQMAAYTCYADNGIAPVANATFLVEVHFSPMISVYRQMIYAEYGQSATLECLVEAFPEAIRYWERAYDGKILDPGEKYRIETYPDGFKTTMRLTVNNLRKDDFGYYHCVARNELNATMVNFEIAPQDPNSETPYVGKEVKVYGQRPPETECPICEHCPDPSLYQCKDAINLDFEIQATGNYSYPGLPKRQKSCLLYAVGKPVFHKAVNELYGCWLKDAAAKEVDRERTFVTNENDSYNLFEFPTKMQFRMNSVPRKKYDIREGFHGNAHVVYNGSFYYHQRNSDLVVKLDLSTLKKITTQLPYSGFASGKKLYSTDYNYMDFNVDEVGLWVIYSTYDSNNTLVAKLDAESLKMQYNFNVTLDHRKFGEMFIVCGHLYAIDSCTDKNSQIRYVVDLYNGKLLNVDLPFSNPFRKTTTVGYNPFTVELYSWDKGNALTYPIRYHEQSLGIADRT